MGTRVVIRKNGKVLVATHWDGYPTELGESLIKGTEKDKSIKNILRIGAVRHIDAVDNRYIDIARDVSIETQKEIISDAKRKLKKTKGDDSVFLKRTIQGAKDFLGRYQRKEQIGTINEYGDFAEWDYDVRDDGVYVAKREGAFREKRISKFRKLTLDNLKQLEDRGRKKGIDFSMYSRGSGRSGWFKEPGRHRLARLKGYARYGR